MGPMTGSDLAKSGLVKVGDKVLCMAVPSNGSTKLKPNTTYTVDEVRLGTSPGLHFREGMWGRVSSFETTTPEAVAKAKDDLKKIGNSIASAMAFSNQDEGFNYWAKVCTDLGYEISRIEGDRKQADRDNDIILSEAISVIELLRATRPANSSEIINKLERKIKAKRAKTTTKSMDYGRSKRTGGKRPRSAKLLLLLK